MYGMHTLRGAPQWSRLRNLRVPPQTRHHRCVPCCGRAPSTRRLSAPQQSNDLVQRERSTQAFPDGMTVTKPTGSRVGALDILNDGPSVQEDAGAERLLIKHPRLGPDPVAFDHLWLRDNCRCASCVHPHSRQKLHLTTDFSPGLRPIDYRFSPDGETLILTWPASPDGPETSHETHFLIEQLSCYASLQSLRRLRAEVDPVDWDSTIEDSSTSLYQGWNDISASPAAMKGFLHQLQTHGLAFVNDVPTHEPSDAPGLKALTSRLGEVRNTFYGMFWDVQAKPKSINIAYTNLNLGLHMDLLYFAHPPHYQFLHCLRNSVQGGASIFVDSYRAADLLRREDPTQFEILTRVPVSFHYINDNHHMYSNHPTIQLKTTGQDLNGRTSSIIDHVNYSPPFQAPFEDVRTGLQERRHFHQAFRRFAEILALPEMQYELILKEGQCVVFDNRRVLHARRAFHSNSDGTGERWLKGCYLDGDVIRDRYRVLAGQTHGWQ